MAGIRARWVDDPINWLNRIKSIVEEDGAGCPEDFVFDPDEDRCVFIGEWSVSLNQLPGKMNGSRS